ncbi:MAG: Yip1 family protein [Hyphomicrobiales bacterium]
MDDQNASLQMSSEGPAGAAPEDMGPLGRLIGVFINPRRTFESMRERPRFLLAAILVLVVQVAIAGVMVQSGVPRDETIAKMERQGADQAKIEAVEKFFDSPIAPAITVTTAVFGVAIALLISAGVLFFMGNLMLGGRIELRHYLSATAYGSVVMLVDNVVRIGLILAKHSYDVRLGLGNVFGEDIGFVGRALDGMTDPLLLWATAVTALAVSVYARKGFGFGILTVLPGFVIGSILQGFRQ